MKLRLDQLNGQLQKKLAPVYLLSGDEPLQLGEALDSVRTRARQVGHESRELYCVDTSFRWGDFIQSVDSYSLFGDQRFIDLRMPSKPDKDAAEVLLRYGERPASDAVLAVSLPKLTVADQKAKWFQALDAIGVFVQIWPLDGQQIIGWLDRRLTQKSMLADRSALAILAARIEGNLLAAAQEIEKLHVLFGQTRIDDDMMRKSVADSARYDVYDLADATMMGQVTRVHRILSALRLEGVASAVVLWALARDIRLLVSVKAMMEQGDSMDAALSKQKEKVFDKRRAALAKATERLSRKQAEQALLLCAQTDRVIKGAAKGDEWDVLLQTCLCVCGRSFTKFFNSF